MSVLTKASFSMTRNIRKNIPLVTRVDDNAWTIRGQLPFPQGLYFIYNNFAGKPIADVYSHHFFLEKDVWPDQPSPRFHLTDETQSTVLVCKGMIHNKDVTTHLDNTMVVCRNPKDHSEFGIYNPSHVDEPTLDHVMSLIEGCGIEPESRNASEKFSLHAAYGSGKGIRNHLKNSAGSSPMQQPGMMDKHGGGGDSKAPALGTAGNTQRMFEAHKKMQLEKKMREKQQKGNNPMVKASDDPATMFDHLDDEEVAGGAAATAAAAASGSSDPNSSEYTDLFEGKKKLPGMVDGDPRLYGDAPWHNLAYRDPEEQLPDDYRRAKDEAERKKILAEEAKRKQELMEKEAKDGGAAAASNKTGTVKWIVVPTRQTWQAVELWRKKFPDAVIYCSGNIPAHLTKEGLETGAVAPAAFSMSSAFTPGLPTPAPPEGTEGSPIMMSSGGHGAKSSKNKLPGSGSVKKYAGDWQKHQIDLTRTRLDFYENESFAGERKEAAEKVLVRAREWEKRVEELMEEHEKGKDGGGGDATTAAVGDVEAEDGDAQGDSAATSDAVASSSASTTTTTTTVGGGGNKKIATRRRQRLPLFHDVFQIENKIGVKRDPVLAMIDAEEVQPEAVKIPKTMEEIDELLAEGQPYIPDRDGFKVVPSTPIEGVKILPRDGSVFPLFGGAFQLLRVSGDPHCNEFLLYKPDSGLVACTDLYHGSYTDFDPMNTWLVRVWFKFQRGGDFKDAGLLPAFRLNALKNLPGGGLSRAQSFVDQLTRAVPMKTLVFAHGSGPLVASADVFGSIAHSTSSMERVHSGETEEERRQRLAKNRQATLVADAIRAQYGLVSLEDAAYYSQEQNGGFKHPVTLAEVFQRLHPEEWARQLEEEKLREEQMSR